jgi:ribosomal protein L18
MNAAEGLGTVLQIVLQIIWHVSNLLLPALALGAVAAALAKGLWRRELSSVTWARLAGPACAACALTTMAGLVVFGRDGRMATYAAMVAACAITLWWQGFGPGRR